MNNVESYGYDKRYMVKELIEDKLYQIKDQFNERKISHGDFDFIHVHLVIEIDKLIRYCLKIMLNK